MENSVKIVSGLVTVAAAVWLVVDFVTGTPLEQADWKLLMQGAIFGAALVAFIALMSFGHDNRKHRLANEATVAEKKASLVQTLPTRIETIKSKREAIADFEISIAEAEGNANSLNYSAESATRNGFRDIAADQLGKSKTWIIKAKYQVGLIDDLIKDIDRLEGMSDEEYLQEEKRLRGLA
jgi:hypothetical protein